MLRFFTFVNSLLNQEQLPSANGPHYTICELTTSELVGDTFCVTSSAYPQVAYEESTVKSTVEIISNGRKSDTLLKSCRVILKQEDRGKVSCYLLAECLDEEEAVWALTAITATLSPFLNHGSISLPKKLLESLILPKPQPVDKLLPHLVEVMEHQPEIYPHWYRIAQALLQVMSYRSSCDNTPVTTTGTTSSKTGHLSIPRVVDLINTPGTFKTSQNSILTRNHQQLALIVTENEDLNENNEEFLTPCASPMNPFPFSLDDSVIESKNNPLLLPLSNGYTRSSLYFLLGGANPNNAVDSDEGNTPLHLAVEKGSLSLVKLLVAFEADPRITNKKGETPLQRALSLGAHDCATILKEVSSLLNAADNLPIDLDLDCLKKASSKLEKEPPFLLTLDGGGVRAIMEIQVLIAIEKRMREICPSSPSILDSFEYIAGTSGGAYVMFITVFGKKNLIDSRSLVFSALNRLSETPHCNEKDRVKTLENILQDMLGTETVMSDVKSPRVMATATLADQSPCKLHLLTNYGGERDGQLGPSDRKVWEAARITSAVPIYFGSYEGKFLDGGMMSNNPTLDAIAEVIDQAETDGTNSQLGLVLSLGSGITECKSISNVDFSLPSWSLSSLLQLPESLRGLRNLGEILLMQLTGSDGQEVSRCRAWCRKMGTDYFRISPPVQTNHHLTESDISKMVGMLYDAQLHVLNEATTIDEIAKTLLMKKL